MTAPPDFRRLLREPLVADPLPSDFDHDQEAEHLERLWTTQPEFGEYDYHRFVHAGGSGMVFKVSPSGTTRFQAMKVARYKLMNRIVAAKDAATSLSPVSQQELQALERMSHPNVVRLFRAIAKDDRVVAICTTFVEPRPIDAYFRTILSKEPKQKSRGSALSPGRLHDACDFLIRRCTELADALVHMHKQGIYHFDLKPANVLVSAEYEAVITDLGACVHAEQLRPGTPIRVRFTWTYAHPELRSIISDPASITGGGLKVSAQVVPDTAGLARFDLFALGRTIQEVLAILEGEFGERCYAEYGFRYVHLLAALLLDGKNAPLATTQQVTVQDGRRFITDIALGYPVSLFQRHRLPSAPDLLERLRRFSRDHAWHQAIPELDPWTPHTINTGPSGNVPFTSRVAAICNHPTVRRLKNELQLGWIKEVYPGATHNRWSHSIGVFAATVKYFGALLADTEVPTFRVLATEHDLTHAFVAALLHDIGQMAFAHDFESACPNLYKHEHVIERLLDEGYWGSPTLRETLKEHWPDISMDRVFSILPTAGRRLPVAEPPPLPIDGVAADILNGPIDADKFDYLGRDSIACGVVYGRGIDLDRLLHSLTIDALEQDGHTCRLALAYKAKGASAVHSVLLGRLQMYQAVYWHHAVRCLQSTFIHCIAATFGDLDLTQHRTFRGVRAYGRKVAELFYHMVICGHPFADAIDAATAGKQLRTLALASPPPELVTHPALEFVWRFADDAVRNLLSRLAKRQIYKRVFELKVEDIGGNADYSALKAELSAPNRVRLAAQLEETFLNAVNRKMQERGPTHSTSESGVHPVPWTVGDLGFKPHGCKAVRR